MHWLANSRNPALDASPANIAQATSREVDESKCSLGNTQAVAQLDAVELQKLYLEDVFRYVARRVPDREEAEDLTAEVFAGAFAALPRFRNQCHPRLWLLGIARRQVLSSLRRRKSRPQSLSALSRAQGDEAQAAPFVEMMAAAGDSPGAALERAEARDAIRNLMSTLKEEQREALLLKYVGELSVNEIAVVMKRSPQAVNSLLQRGRKTLFERGRKYFLDDELNDSDAPSNEVTR